jgi:hypothetical protein
MRLAGLLILLLLQACIYVPRTTSVYDEECKTHTRHMTLQPAQIGHFGSCHGRDCAYVLVALGAVAAASAVVSGSIVLAGNVVYWAEKQGQCLRPSALGGRDPDARADRRDSDHEAHADRLARRRPP